MQTCLLNRNLTDSIDWGTIRSSPEVALSRFSGLLRLERTTRHNVQALLLAMLAFAVLAWGLHYKLSLYGSEAAQHLGPRAKLLSQRERLAPCTEMDGPLLSGWPAPRMACPLFRVTAPALTENAHAAISDRYLEDAMPQLGSLAKRSRHLVPSNPRGPPSAV